MYTSRAYDAVQEEYIPLQFRRLVCSWCREMMQEKKRLLLNALMKIVQTGIVRTRNVVNIPDRDPNVPAVFALLSYWIIHSE